MSSEMQEHLRGEDENSNGEEKVELGKWNEQKEED